MEDLDFRINQKITNGDIGDELMYDIDSLRNPIKEVAYYNKAISYLLSNNRYEFTLIKSLNSMNDLAISRIGENNKKLEKMVMTDDLTGLLNKKGFDYRMSEEIAKAERLRFDDEDYNFSLLFLDVDYFKNFNDNYGHQAGDRVLRTLSDIFKKGRKGDIFCRYGGDEFAIILPTTDICGALESGYNLNKKVSGHVMEFEDRNGNIHREPIRISVGVDSFVKGDSLNSLLKRVDDNLYAAKNAGKNCVFGDGKVYC